MKHPWVRWLPAAVVPVAIAAGAIIAPLAAGAADLPSKTPDEVLRLMAASETRSFSGTVEQTSHLGLPTLPSVGSGPGSSSDQSAASTLELLTADHTANVYVDGPTRMRVQVLDQLAERDVIRNGTDVWLYQSKGEQVTHATVPARATESAPDAAATTPSALAQHFLAAVDPSTSVTLGANTSVHGRDAYDLVLTPRTDATLVGSVSIAVDGDDGSAAPGHDRCPGPEHPRVPGRVHIVLPVRSGGRATSRSPRLRGRRSPSSRSVGGHKPHSATAHPKPSVSGTGWDAVVSLPAGSVPAGLTSSPLYGELTTPVDGGRAFSTALVSVLVTDDGRVFAGAVPVQTLQAAAAR